MLALLRPAAVLLLLFTLLTGLAYPLGFTGLAQAIFPEQAGGSLLTRDGRVIGSRLIGQAFAGPDWFQGRPSAIGYDAGTSGGGNLGQTSAGLLAAVTDRTRALTADAAGLALPLDLVTASASGLDPHISPAAALLQAPRVAAARGLPPAAVEALVRGAIEPPLLGFIGEPRVNVLELNLALTGLASRS